jgi:DNA-binding MarR family transcriptional regulator
MLTASSSNVIRLQTPEKNTRPRFGKVFCSDWLHSVADQVTSAEFHVLFMLSRHADDEYGTTRVSAGTIADACNLNRAYVQKVLRGLVGKGIIGREGGGTGPRNAAEYLLLADKNKVADFHDDLRDRRKARRAAFATDVDHLVQTLISDVGHDTAREFIDSFEGDDDAATAVLMKIATWRKEARRAYIEKILDRRHMR